MRPQLTEAQADLFRREEILRYTGRAGADRADPWDPPALEVRQLAPDYIVGQGHGVATVQQAVDRAIAAGWSRRVVIGVAPGIYHGLIYLPRLPFPVTLVGLGRHPSETVLAESIDAEMPGTEYLTRFEAQFASSSAPVAAIFRRIAARATLTTANASVLRIEADDTQLLNLTIRNTYNADRAQEGSQERNAFNQYTRGQHQAVALLVAGADRVLLQNVHLRSHQDTLYLQSPTKGETVRSCLVECDIAGDVDFIFGQSTAWFSKCRLRSLGHRAPRSWVTAPSTDIRTRYGFVFDDCDFVHDGSSAGPSGRFRLGRQWFEGVRATPYGASPVPDYRCDLGPVSTYAAPCGTISRETLNSVGKCVILRSRIGTHIDSDTPWDDWAGNQWTPRHRPAQFTAGDMLRNLANWLAGQGISYDDIDPEMVFLGEYGNLTVEHREPN